LHARITPARFLLTINTLLQVAPEPVLDDDNTTST
jgi:hypothetical protein